MRRPEVTRRRIMEAAGRLFAERGFRGVGFRDITSVAHVSLRMPNHHFGAKGQLFAQCVRYALMVQLKFLGIFVDAPPRSGRRAADHCRKDPRVFFRHPSTFGPAILVR